MTLFHYTSPQKLESILKNRLLIPSAPFNSNISKSNWDKYAKNFSFSIFPFYTCCFVEKNPKRWVEYGLFSLLMNEFSGGQHLLKLTISDNEIKPIIVRDHKFHSPKEYGYKPEIWMQKKIRNSRPDLRQKWYNSTVLLSKYEGSYICPEVLIPFNVPLAQIEIIR